MYEIKVHYTVVVSPGNLGGFINEKPEVNIIGTSWMKQHSAFPYRDMMDDIERFYPRLLDFIVENNLLVEWTVELHYEEEISEWVVWLMARCEYDGHGFMMKAHMSDNATEFR